MSGNRKEKSGSSGAILSTIAAVGIGAIAAAGAFFVGKALGAEEAEAQLKAQHYYQNRQGQGGRTHPPPTSDEDDDDDPKFKSGGAGVLEKECAICMSEFEELKARDVEIHTTPCGHLFCAKCLSRCLGRREECPTCKQPVKQGQTLRIFL